MARRTPRGISVHFAINFLQTKSENLDLKTSATLWKIGMSHSHPPLQKTAFLRSLHLSPWGWTKKQQYPAVHSEPREEMWLVELLIPWACQLMACLASQLSLPRAGVLNDNELACKASVEGEWGRESSVYHGVWNSSILAMKSRLLSSFSVCKLCLALIQSKRKIGAGLWATSLCKLSALSALQTPHIWKPESFFITFKSPFCNKSGGLFVFPVWHSFVCRLCFFLGRFFPGMLRSFNCSLLLHPFPFTNVNLLAGVCWQPPFLSAWIVSTGLDVNQVGMLGFFPHILPPFQAWVWEKKGFCSGRAKSMLVKTAVKLPLLCCRWTRRLMGSYYSLLIPQLSVCLCSLTETHLSSKQSRTRAMTWAWRYHHLCCLICIMVRGVIDGSLC